VVRTNRNLRHAIREQVLLESPHTTISREQSRLCSAKWSRQSIVRLTWGALCPRPTTARSGVYPCSDPRQTHAVHRVRYCQTYQRRRQTSNLLLTWPALGHTATRSRWIHRKRNIKKWTPTNAELAYQAQPGGPLWWTSCQATRESPSAPPPY
jgi:hypothetical protein